jgi:hypothetical protein
MRFHVLNVFIGFSLGGLSITLSHWYAALSFQRLLLTSLSPFLHIARDSSCSSSDRLRKTKTDCLPGNKTFFTSYTTASTLFSISPR